jgi:hypothetical protein
MVRSNLLIDRPCTGSLELCLYSIFAFPYMGSKVDGESMSVERIRLLLFIYDM